MIQVCQANCLLVVSWLDWEPCCKCDDSPCRPTTLHLNKVGDHHDYTKVSCYLDCIDNFFIDIYILTRSSKRMNLAPDQTIILGLQIFFSKSYRAMEFPRRREYETYCQCRCYQHAAGWVELPSVLRIFSEDWDAVLLCSWSRRFQNAGEEIIKW